MKIKKPPSTPATNQTNQTNQTKQTKQTPPTSFQLRVYALLCTVPRGAVTTYGRLAAALGCASPRAVGMALRRNPFAPRVPCHRVIAADLSIGGFNGQTSGPEIARKIALLRSEGITLSDDGHLLDRTQLWEFQA